MHWEYARLWRNIRVNPALKVESLKEVFRRWGWSRAMFILMMKGLGKILGIHIHSIWTRPLTSSPPDPNLPPGVSLRILDRATLLAASKDPELQMSCAFVESALARGDVAFGALDGTTLVAYMWRTVSVAPYADALWIKVEHPYRYGYNSFTRPKYRGRHINSALSFFSDAYFLERGYTKHINFVDVSNLSSLATRKYRAEERIGFAGYVKWFGRYFTFRTPAVRKTGFELFLR